MLAELSLPYYASSQSEGGNGAVNRLIFFAVRALDLPSQQNRGITGKLRSAFSISRGFAPAPGLSGKALAADGALCQRRTGLHVSCRFGSGK